jgi:hypothetical protein
LGGGGKRDPSSFSSIRNTVSKHTILLCKKDEKDEKSVKMLDEKGNTLYPQSSNKFENAVCLVETDETYLPRRIGF